MSGHVYIFKGHPILSLYDGPKNKLNMDTIRFGYAKARCILKNIEEIKQFVRDVEQNKYKSLEEGKTPEEKEKEKSYTFSSEDKTDTK